MLESMLVTNNNKMCYVGVEILYCAICLAFLNRELAKLESTCSNRIDTAASALAVSAAGSVQGGPR